MNTILLRYTVRNVYYYLNVLDVLNVILNRLHHGLQQFSMNTTPSESYMNKINLENVTLNASHRILRTEYENMKYILEYSTIIY